MPIEETGALYAKLQAMCYGMSYAFFDSSLYNVNIIAFRSLPGEPNKFDDILTLSYRRDKYNPVTEWYRCTTDPGLYYLNNPMLKAGTAVVAPQQLRAGFKIGKHKGVYECLVQSKPIKVYRDRNKDNIIDLAPGTLVSTNSGIQIHRASRDFSVAYVNKYSAGCIVVQDPQDFESFMAVIGIAAERWGSSFTFTLIELPTSSLLSLLDIDKL